ncbi:MAG: hypothetical protein A2X34_02575 [Elusimicrobia bacterium GWC2_51_8]|nr:MAG: hypothetical protein A2X33_00950 [Elusimicrobia bacterium GWA2_51_34]OGR60189.1 MAG: hypothetical protein A2X34_02575 [Elusimicrobia bacterium GWC2_51_8]HCE98869.1 hypothetical protein [Elusimicrobiota bacterium]
MLPEELIKKIALKNGASICGFAPAGPLAEHARFLRALEDLPPSLGYLARNSGERADIRNWFAGAHSVLICAFSYWPSDGLTPGLDYKKTLERVGEPETFLERSGRKIRQPGFFEAGNRAIARYALGPDYHAAVKEKLLKIVESMKPSFPLMEGRAFVDTSPVLEKELGRLAGLGFRGKNTLLINPKFGSYFVLGGVALNLKLKSDAPLDNSFAGPRPFEAPSASGGGAKEDGCGDCDLCIRACPTGALKDGRLLASKCVSYLTTQAKEKVPAAAVFNSGGFAYGCDICQEVCPFNGIR